MTLIYREGGVLCAGLAKELTAKPIGGKHLTTSADSFPPDDLATFYGVHLINVWINEELTTICKLMVGRPAALMADPATLRRFHLALT